VLFVSVLAAAGSAGAAAVLTLTTGNVLIGGEIRFQHDVLAMSERINLEGNATASLIVDDSAIVRLCHGASLGCPATAYSSACLDDGRYRVAAVAAARSKCGRDSVGPIALMDLEGEDTVPTVAAGPPIIPTGTLGPPGALFVRPCLSYQQCVQPSKAPPIFKPYPLPDNLPQILP
jgi:hypothetical protein